MSFPKQTPAAARELIFRGARALPSNRGDRK